MYLVKVSGADVDQGKHNGAPPLYIAAQEDNLAMVRCMGKELGANVNQGKHDFDGATPLMIAATTKNENVVAFLIKYMYGANPKLSGLRFGTAADISKNSGARIRQRRADAVPRVVQNILRALLKSG
jgi:ankyrin repeat protein